MRRIDGRARGWLAALGLGAALFCAGALAAPAAVGALGPQADLLRLAYRPLCHQIPARCLDLGWGPLALCARCAGLYLGGTVALLAVVVLGRAARPPGRWLAVVAAPTAVDFIVGQLGPGGLPNWPRFTVALPLGALCALYLADATIDAVCRRRAADPVQ